MITKKWFVCACAGGALALGIAACGDSSSDSTSSGSSSAGSGDLSGEIAGAGSSAQEAAQEAWIAGVQGANADVTISYDPVGSGGGREQFNAGGVNYAGTDSSFADEELTAAEKQCGGAENFVQIPAYVSPIAVIYNLPDVDSLQLSPDTIAGIFKQEITTWNDPAIAADNPDATLPDTRITPVNRSDDSGTTANFTDYLSKAAPSVWTFPPDDTWPVKGGESAEGTSGVVEAVTAGEGTIGYADASQAGDLGIANVGVGDSFIEPTADGAAHDVEISKESTSVGGAEYVTAYELERTSTDTANYPVVLVSYLATCTSGDGSDIVKALFDYAISAEGQQAAADNAGSAPITDKVREQIQPSVDAIQAG
ncbi:MAG: phosphate transport system substrate-binding protein [Solirubrobacterales bacterium]|nr:phosphate transport system substrate-binding protein [Solirubrobacterales bacterium]